MIYREDCTLLKEYLEQLEESGLKDLPEMIHVLINEAMQIERAKYIQAGPYQRITRCSYRESPPPRANEMSEPRDGPAL